MAHASLPNSWKGSLSAPASSFPLWISLSQHRMGDPIPSEACCLLFLALLWACTRVVGPMLREFPIASLAPCACLLGCGVLTASFPPSGRGSVAHFPDPGKHRSLNQCPVWAEVLGMSSMKHSTTGPNNWYRCWQN